MRDPETIEEELALFAEAIEAGIDPFPPRKETKPIARYALAVHGHHHDNLGLQDPHARALAILFSLRRPNSLI